MFHLIDPVSVPVELGNDVVALDRVLASLGYEGDLDAIMPQERSGRMFSNGSLCAPALTRYGRVDRFKRGTSQSRSWKRVAMIFTTVSTCWRLQPMYRVAFAKSGRGG